jgi:hypothetical protein
MRMSKWVMTLGVWACAIGYGAGCTGTTVSTGTGSHGSSSGSHGSTSGGTSAGTSGTTGSHGSTGASGTTGASGSTGTTGAVVIPGSFAAACAGHPTTLTGKVTFPNGVDPVSAAHISVVTSTTALPTGVSCDKCGQTDNATAIVSTDSATNGVFTLSLDDVPQSATVQLLVRKGRFRKVTPVTVSACNPTPLAAGATQLPGKAVDGDVPKIAVTSGNSDHLNVVLDALGIEYTCYKGISASSDPCTNPKTLADLLRDPTTLNSYGMLFIACSFGGTYESVLNDASALANLQAYVNGGGKVIVTDDSYDYVEQAFPDAINFEPATATPAVAQPKKAAEIGTGNITTNATLHDDNLKAWMQAIGSLNSDGTVAVTGFLSQWAVMSSVDTTTRNIVDGPVSFTGGSNVVRPLTVEFERNQCGRVIYSSYHTEGRAHAGLIPQERILEYLMMEVSTCVQPR